MLHRYATASAILASSMALSTSAFAQNVGIQFSGIVPAQVNFTNVAPGTVETKTSNVASGTSNIMESVAPTLVNVQSTIPAMIIVSPPQLVSGPNPDPSGTRAISFLNFGSTSVRSDIGNGTANIPAGNTLVELRMRVERPALFVPGVYTYSITLTVTQ